MPDFPPFSEYFRVARDEVLGKNSKLTVEVLDRPGTDANVLVAASAAVADEVTGQLARVAASLFLDSAQKRALDRLVFDRYNILRKPATPSFGTVAFSTAVANPAAFSIPVNTRLQTTDGKTFLVITSGVFPGGSTGPVLVSVRSADAGLSQQAAVGTITNILDMPPGAPGDLVVTNTLATAGADDEEKDDQLRERARRFFVTARRGTLAAIQTAAESVSGVRRATAFEVLDEFGRPAKSVNLVIADAFTESLIATTPTPAAYQTQSQTLATQVFIALDEWRAAGVFVDVQVGSVTLLGVQLGLTFQAGVNADVVALRARAQVVSYINELAPGQRFVPADAVERLRRVPGLIVTGGEVLSPAGVVVPQQLEILRTTLGLVIAVSLQPDRSLQGSANPDAV